MKTIQPLFKFGPYSKGVDQKIIIAFERLSRIFRILLWDVAKRKGLSPIQIQSLIHLYDCPDRLCRISQLAKEFGLTKATVSNAVKSLRDKGLVLKQTWPDDKRVSVLKLNAAGKELAKKLLRWNSIMQKRLKEFPSEDKENLIFFLMQFIDSLQRAGLIDVVRMCISCANFEKDVYPQSKKPHRCRLTGRVFADSGLNIDCDRHQQRLIAV